MTKHGSEFGKVVSVSLNKERKKENPESQFRQSTCHSDLTLTNRIISPVARYRVPEVFIVNTP